MKNKDAHSLNSKICSRIKQLRIQKGWSQDQLSEKAGFTKSYLSQIENHKKEPPISTLNKIAYALELDVLELITGQKSKAEHKPFTLVRSGERRSIAPPSALPTVQYESISYKRAKRLMDGYVLTLGFEFPKETNVHGGEELVFVLEGETEFFYDGKIYNIKAGDSYYFDSNRPHYSRSIGDIPAKLLVVFASKAIINPGE
ncbi:MAG: helix-turn-helix domain-containing protein [Hyphomicrobiales bacterium]